MLLMTTLAFAAATDCPEVNLPSDAKQQYPGDVEGFYDQIQQWAESTLDSSCIQECEDPGGYEVCKEADCVTADGVAFSYSLIRDVEEGTATTSRTIELVAAPEMSWGSFYFNKTQTESEDYTSGDTGVITRWESSWTGSLPDLPDDFDAVGTITHTQVYETGSTSDAIEFDEDNGCYWRWTNERYQGEEQAFYEVFERWSIQTFATENFTVEHLYGGCSGDFGGTYTASLNGEYLGQVDGDTWAFVGKDDDGDGWSVEGGDPDDNDSLNVPCTEEEEQEEEIEYDDKLCGLVSPVGLLPLGLVLLGLRRRT